jgi:hypothetical protein
MARASLDQFIAAPLVLGGFFAFAGFLEGKGVEDVKTKVETVSLGDSPLSYGWFVGGGD